MPLVLVLSLAFDFTLDATLLFLLVLLRLLILFDFLLKRLLLELDDFLEVKLLPSSAIASSSSNTGSISNNISAA